MILCNLFNILSRVWNKFIISPIIKTAFVSCGKRVNLAENWNYTSLKIYMWEMTLELVQILFFMCTRARIIIGDRVMFGLGISVITGDHRIDISVNK